MSWEVEYTNKLVDWWAGLLESERKDIAATVELLTELGPGHQFPNASGVEVSGHGYRHTYFELTKDFTPNRRARVDARKDELRAAAPMYELRRAQSMTQRAVGVALNVNQPGISKLEQRTDFCVSNHRSYIEALGGRLNIVAEFPGEMSLLLSSSRPETKHPQRDEAEFCRLGLWSGDLSLAVMRVRA